MKARIAEKRAELCKAQQELRMKLLLISEQEYDRAESCKSCAEKVSFNDMIEESIHNLQCQIDDLDEDMYQLEAQELFEVEGEKIVNQMPKAQFGMKAPSYPHMQIDLKSVDMDGDNASFNLVNGCEYIGLNIRLEFAPSQCNATVHGLAPYDDQDFTVHYDEPRCTGNASVVNWSDDVFAVQDMPVELTFAQAAALNEHLDNLAQDKAKELAA